MKRANNFRSTKPATRRPLTCGLRLETLEERLPPGDAWLGAALGALVLDGSSALPIAAPPALPSQHAFHSAITLLGTSRDASPLESFRVSQLPTPAIQDESGTALAPVLAQVVSTPALSGELALKGVAARGGRGDASLHAAVANADGTGSQPGALAVVVANQTLPATAAAVVGSAAGEDPHAAFTDPAFQSLLAQEGAARAATVETAGPTLDKVPSLPPRSAQLSAAPSAPVMSEPASAEMRKDSGGMFGPRQVPDYFPSMTQDMRDNHGKYDNLYTAKYEDWLAGRPFQSGGEVTGGREYGADARMSTPPFNGSQNEFQIDINPADTRFAIGTSNSGRPSGVGIYLTSDGGETWRAMDPPGVGSACCDPAVAYGSDGVAYVGILRVGTGQITLRTTDNGATWQTAGTVRLEDRNNIAVDPRDSNIVYTTYSELGGANSQRIKGYRSTDGGQTWGTNFFIGGPAPAQGYQQSSQPRVAHDGTVYVGYQQYLDSGAGCGAGVQNVLAKSTDGGQTWTHTVLDIRQGGACTPGQAGRGIFCINAGGGSFRSRSHPIIDVHPTDSNIVYMVYSGGDLENPYTCSGSTGFHSDTLFRKSVDGGKTFSDPIRINTDPLGNDQYYPWIDVAPNGRIWVGWNDRRNDPQNFRSRWYQAYSNDGGDTWTEEMVADVDTQPSTFIGDYQGLAAQDDRVLGMWYDSRVNASGDPFTDPHFQFGLAVLNSTPARDAIVTTALTEFVVNLSHPYEPATVDASDLTVNTIPASSVEQTDPTTLTFRFDSSPITTEGPQAMAMEAGAIERAGDNDPLRAFGVGFRYDAIRLGVDATDPAVGSGVLLPFTQIRVTFNEPYDPATVGTNDLTLSQGTVTAATPVDKQTVDYTLSGVTIEGVLTARMASGALTDLFGNPSVPFEGSYFTDIGTVPLPALQRRGTAGSWVYDTAAAGLIGPADDTDGFSVRIDPYQTISVVVTPTTPASLQPSIALYAVLEEPVLLASTVANQAGQAAVLQAVPTVDDLASPLEYSVVVTGAAGTIGGYRVQLTLNAAVESEAYNGPANDTIESAQDLDASFQNLVPGQSGPARAVVAGRADFSAGLLPDEIEPNNTLAGANIAAANFAPFTGSRFHLGIKAQLNTNGDEDWYQIGALEVGDILTITMSASGSRRGAVSDTFVHLYRDNAGTPTQVAADDDSGPGLDSLIYRFRVTASDTYYIRSRHYSSGMGTYDLGLWLENTGKEPTTGGKGTTETEPNNSAATANDFSANWRAISYQSRTAGTINPANDTDFFQFQFTAGDLVSIYLTGVSAGLDMRVNLLNAAGTVLAAEDGSSGGPDRDSYTYSFIIPTTGTYYVQALGSGTGTYTADVFLSTETPPPDPRFGYDYFSLALAAGESVTVGVLGQPSSVFHVELLDGNDMILAAGQRGATNFSELISNFTAAEDGRYYLRVAGALNLDYHLTLTRNADFDTEVNDDLARAQALAASRLDGRQWVAGHAGVVTQGVPDADVYQVALAPGAVLTLETFTPADQDGAFVNTFDPRLVVYNGLGEVVASDDNSAADGRNAFLTYTVPAGGAGTYYLQVLPSDQTNPLTLGEYVLAVQGAGEGGSPTPGGGATRVPGVDPAALLALTWMGARDGERSTAIRSPSAASADAGPLSARAVTAVLEQWFARPTHDAAATSPTQWMWPTEGTGEELAWTVM